MTWIMFSRTSLEIQWLRVHSQCWGPGSTRGQGTRSHMLQLKKKKKQKVEHILYSDAWFRYRQEPRGCGTLVGSLHPAPGVHLTSLTQLSMEVALFTELKTRWKQTRLTSPWNWTSSLTSPWIPGPKFLLCGFWNTYHLSSGAVLVSLCCADPKCNMVTSCVWEVLGGFGETETL